MGTFFRSIRLFRYQQVRHLPRFNAAPKLKVPEKVPEILPTEEIISPAKKSLKKPLLRRTECLVIKSGNEANEQRPGKSAKRSRPTKLPEEVQQPLLTDADGKLVYTKLANNDIRISKAMADVKTKKTSMLLEGKRLIREGLMAKCRLRCIFFSRLQDVECLKPHLPERGVLYKATYKDLQLWSDLTTNPGLMAVFDIPSSAARFEPDHKPLPLTIVCDNVREPNNLGAILRTSSGAGCERLLLTKGCVNLWDSKVLRAACGAHFKLELAKDLEWDKIESLIPANANVLIADSKTVSAASDNADCVGEVIRNIPVLPYYSPNFRLMQHLVLVIGGETEGVSDKAYRLAKDFNGARLHVPLNNKVESLNTGTALGIIVFEIKRQLMISDNQQ